MTHTLQGHNFGFVIPVRWHPTRPHLLASGGSDGTVRLWDVRRGKACLASLDQHNSATKENAKRLTASNRAHDGVVNGIEFTGDGLFLVSLGHDEKMRVWDLETGMNTLVLHLTCMILMRGILWSLYSKSTSDGSNAIYHTIRYLPFVSIGVYSL